MSQDPRRGALNSLRSIVHALYVSSRASEKALGIGTAQLFVLRQIAAAGTCTISELAEDTLTEASSVSVVVARLLDLGLAERLDVAAHRPRAEIACTPAGHARLADAPRLVQDRLIWALSAMDEPELLSLAHALELLVASLDETAQPVRMFFEADEAQPDSPGGGLGVRSS